MGWKHSRSWRYTLSALALALFCMTISIPAFGQSENAPVANEAQRTTDKLARTRELINANAAQNALNRNDPASRIPKPSEAEGSGAIVMMLQGLAFCVGIFLIGSWIFKRYAPRRFVASASGRRMKIVERLAVTSRSSIALIEVDGREVLVSLGSESTQMLSLPNKDFILSREQQDLLESPELGGAL